MSKLSRQDGTAAYFLSTLMSKWGEVESTHDLLQYLLTTPEDRLNQEISDHPEWVFHEAYLTPEARTNQLSRIDAFKTAERDTLASPYAPSRIGFIARQVMRAAAAEPESKRKPLAAMSELYKHCLEVPETMTSTDKGQALLSGPLAHLRAVPSSEDSFVDFVTGHDFAPAHQDMKTAIQSWINQSACTRGYYVFIHNELFRGYGFRQGQNAEEVMDRYSERTGSFEGMQRLAYASDTVMRTDEYHCALAMNDRTVFDGKYHFANLDELQSQFVWRADKKSPAEMDIIQMQINLCLTLHLDFENSTLHIGIKEESNTTLLWSMYLWDNVPDQLDFYMELSEQNKGERSPYLYLDMGLGYMRVALDSAFAPGVEFVLFDKEQDARLATKWLSTDKEIYAGVDRTNPNDPFNSI
jgi:hypothetical protein